jgi:hypothetical protein
MRCLPENAKYSHAVLEVLTRTNTSGKGYSLKKTVGSDSVEYPLYREFNEDGEFIGLVFVNDDGEKVFANATIDGMTANDVCDKILGITDLVGTEILSDFLSEYCQGDFTVTEDTRNIVEVIPRISYVPSGATSKAVLDAYIANKQNGLVSIQPFGGTANDIKSGYRRHVLGYFMPEGRGAKYYNDFRIDLKLATNYDQNYDFRVYSLTFQKYDARNDEWGIVYGPFYVSFDETARDSSNESMFIADVLNTYCDEFDFIVAGEEGSGDYNIGFYNAAKAIGGSEAPLGRVDILSCKEFYSEETGFSMIHRNAVINGGVVTLRKNVAQSATKLYVNEITPIAGCTLIVGESKQVKAASCNITSGEISVDGSVFSDLYYSIEELAELPAYVQNEVAGASVVKDVTPVVYVNDLGTFGGTATVKTMDDAIRKVSTKKYRIYLNNNGADFYPKQDVSIDISQLVKYTDDATMSTVTITAVSDATLDEDIIKANDVFTFNGSNKYYKTGSVANSKIYFARRNAESGTGVIWELIDATGSSPVVLETVNGDADDLTPADVTWTKLTLTYTANDVTVSKPSAISGKIVSIDELNNSVVIELDEALTGFEDYDFGTIDDAEFDGTAGGSFDSPIRITCTPSADNFYNIFYSLTEGDFIFMLYGSAGDVDTADGASRATVAETRKSLLVKAFRGTLNEGVVMKKFYPFDVVLDANYDDSIKSSINYLTRVREDFFFACDTGFTANADQAILKRNGALNFNNIYTAIFTQDMRVFDEYTNKVIKVTPTYFLAKKIPFVDNAFGVQYSFVGPRRGEIEGAVEGSLSWNPNEETKEKLYKKQLNYIQKDPNHFMFMGQLTSQKRMSSLSDIPNVRALLVIRRDVEAMMEEYTFERIDDMLLSNMTSALNEYLSIWTSNGTCDSAVGSVNATEYDRKQKLCRVNIELKFTSFLERVIITFNIK